MLSSWTWSRVCRGSGCYQIGFCGKSSRSYGGGLSDVRLTKASSSAEKKQTSPRQESQHQILDQIQEALGSNVEIKRLTHFAASVGRSYLVYHYHVSYLFSDGILDQSRSGLRCDPVIPLVQGKAHEQPPKRGSGTVKHGALTYFDLQTWIHLGSFFIFGIRLWGWLTCGDPGGDFLDYLTSFNHPIHDSCISIHENSLISIHECSWIHSSQIISNHF